VNEKGPPILMHLPPCPAMPPQAFREAIDSGGSTLLDVRSVLDFGGGHIDGALNIANRSELSTWAGWMLDADRPVLLVLDDDADLEEVCRRLLRVGLVRFAGYLAGGMVAWEKAGFDVVPLPQMSVHDLRRDSDGLHVLDVRSEDEFESGHVPGAIHVHVPELPRRLGELKSDRPYAVFCGSGYRASIAASMLQQYGFEDVRNVIGSWKAWTAAEFPVEESGKG
jgi:hydroxyacylglutathione hydrolase